MYSFHFTMKYFNKIYKNPFSSILQNGCCDVITHAVLSSDFGKAYDSLESAEFFKNRRNDKIT